MCWIRVCLRETIIPHRNNSSVLLQRKTIKDQCNINQYLLQTQKKFKQASQTYGMIRIRWNIRLTELGSFILLWKIDKLCRDLSESINTTDQHSFTTEQGFSASIHIQIHLLIHISLQFFLVWHQQVPVQVLQPVFSSCVSSRAAGVGTLSASRDPVSLRDVLLSFYLYLQYLYLVLNDHIFCSCKRTGISYYKFQSVLFANLLFLIIKCQKLKTFLKKQSNPCQI